MFGKSMILKEPEKKLVVGYHEIWTISAEFDKLQRKGARYKDQEKDYLITCTFHLYP
jgi:hypothetical protein